MASTSNPFDLLVDNDTDDLSELIKFSVVVDKKAAQKQSPPAAVAVPAKSAAKLPSKPLPPSQAVREARSDDGHGGGHGGRGRGPEYGERNGVFNGYSGGVYNKPSEDGKPVERRGGYGGPQGSFLGGRGGGVGVCDGVDGERPRRVFERRSGTGRGNDFKRDGAGRGDWGTQDDETTVAKEEILAEKAKTGDEVKICAACAMDWSIELDKGLRSRKPGAAVDAIRRIGTRLEEWGREPEYTMAVYRTFGLIPGEDRLFASSILLKLADAFRVGDNEVKRAVVDMFCLKVEGRRSRGKKGICGIFAKCTADNFLEMLRRVKEVFVKAGSDVQLRADCLVLFGCWADFAGENAHVRHLILTSLASVHDVVVEAALFAAGCFCEQSDDFAYVVLHILNNLVASSKTLLHVKLAGIRIFGKMQSSYLLTQKAYKAAKMLMHSFTDEDVLAALNTELSKLASDSNLFVSELVTGKRALLSSQSGVNIAH